MICKKCTGNMSGPKYVKRPFGGEFLSYRCMTCGYEEKMPTADSKEEFSTLRDKLKKDPS